MTYNRASATTDFIQISEMYFETTQKIPIYKHNTEIINIPKHHIYMYNLKVIKFHLYYKINAIITVYNIQLKYFLLIK